MVGVDRPEHPAAPVPVLPSVSDDGQAAHAGGAGVPAGRCSEGISVLRLYGELLRMGFAPEVQYLLRAALHLLLTLQRDKGKRPKGLGGGQLIMTGPL